MYATRGVWGRHWRLVSFTLGVVLVFWLLYVLRVALFPFILGLMLAYLLLPVIKWLEAKLPYPGRWQQAKRVALILLIFIAFLGLVVALSFSVASAATDAFSSLIQNAPQYISAGLITLQQWAGSLREQLPPQMQAELDNLLLDAGTLVGNAIRQTFTRGLSFVQGTVSFVFGLAALPIFLFYLLKDAEKLHQGFYTAFSPWLAEHLKNIIGIIEGVLGRYIRAQLLLGLIVGYFVFVGLVVLRLTAYAPALAAFAGLTELIPTVGPWIGGAVAVVVTLAVAPDKAIWVALLFLAVQLVENNLLVPRIEGRYLKLHPAVIIVLLVLGAYLAGFWGVILAVPLAATAVAIYKYVHRNLGTAG
ncbi:MAG: AI-2E family transporter [Chloroflexota bacterium]